MLVADAARQGVAHLALCHDGHSVAAFARSVAQEGHFRSVRVLDRAAKMGFEAYSALEFEYFMFDETPESIREKNYKNLTPMTPGWSWLMISTGMSSSSVQSRV